MSHDDTNAKSPLDAAQKIVSELKGMQPEQQSLALKFAMETLGLQPAVPSVITPQPSGPAHPQVIHGVDGAGHSTDIKSFTTNKAPKSDQQFAAVVAYYYQFEAPINLRKPSIDVSVMKDAARLAGRAQAPQWRFTLQNAKNAGYLDAAGDGQYKLSPVGENLVAITLPGNGEGGQARKTSKKKPSTKKTRKAR